MIRETVIVLLALYATASNGTQVFECGTGEPYEDDSMVKISACDKPPCILKRNSKVGVSIDFTPETDVPIFKTTVNARILGLPVPFIGVNGANACNFIHNEDGSKASCPLEKGKKYVYKSEFPVYQAYPRLDTVVHWALTEGQKDLTCFEVPARIVS